VLQNYHQARSGQGQSENLMDAGAVDAIQEKIKNASLEIVKIGNEALEVLKAKQKKNTTKRQKVSGKTTEFENPDGVMVSQTRQLETLAEIMNEKAKLSNMLDGLFLTRVKENLLGFVEKFRNEISMYQGTLDKETKQKFKVFLRLIRVCWKVISLKLSPLRSPLG
jgi:hypothetical protein